MLSSSQNPQSSSLLEECLNHSAAQPSPGAAPAGYTHPSSHTDCAPAPLNTHTHAHTHFALAGYTHLSHTHTPLDHRGVIITHTPLAHRGMIITHTYLAHRGMIITHTYVAQRCDHHTHLAHRGMNRCLTLLVIKEMETKTPLNLRLAKIQNRDSEGPVVCGRTNWHSLSRAVCQ